MKKERRTHSREFKQEAVALVVEHGYSLAAAGRSLGVKGALIGRWKMLIQNRMLYEYLAAGPAHNSD